MKVGRAGLSVDADRQLTRAHGAAHGAAEGCRHEALDRHACALGLREKFSGQQTAQPTGPLCHVMRGRRRVRVVIGNPGSGLRRMDEERSGHSHTVRRVSQIWERCVRSLTYVSITGPKFVTFPGAKYEVERLWWVGAPDR